jgi:DNA-binding CsgD family transcriptional regulator
MGKVASFAMKIRKFFWQYYGSKIYFRQNDPSISQCFQRFCLFTTGKMRQNYASSRGKTMSKVTFEGEAQGLKIELLFCYNDSMSIWQRILYWIGLRSDPGPRFYEFSESMHTTLSTLAEFEGQPEDEFAQTLLSSGLDQYYAQEEILKRWNTLTKREQDVAAYVCLGYTNRQIGKILSISSDTVKFHLHNVFIKYDVKSRTQLQQLMDGLDFSQWDRQI